MRIEAAGIAAHRQPETETGAVTSEAPGTDLVELAKNDAQAFDRLMRVHERHIFATAWRLLGSQEDAQDAAQEVFLRLYRYLHRFETDRPLSPWLYRVTVNVCRDLGRRRRARRAISIEDLEDSRPLTSDDPDADPDAVASLKQERRIIEAALTTLAEKERAAVVLRDIQGLTTAETAAILGLPAAETTTAESTANNHLATIDDISTAEVATVEVPAATEALEPPTQQPPLSPILMTARGETGRTDPTTARPSTEPLVIKLLSEDADLVIYWLVQPPAETPQEKIDDISAV